MKVYTDHDTTGGCWQPILHRRKRTRCSEQMKFTTASSDSSRSPRTYLKIEKEKQKEEGLAKWWMTAAAVHMQLFTPPRHRNRITS